ncbi:hypothetical protein LSUB1_G004940 [Lachnellula subtilissima]|uniref:Uncharacterized protein n=1 Tax=Lachnellula subtilissima TaxID=602034 RepID=A0A8H8RMC4_9HELO|nr:hypothetical protein LSUB1_G004940 [Lachnellula subtilissima]
MVLGYSILASAVYQGAQCPPDSVILSTIFPLKLLCLLSPSKEQKTMAWNEGLSDIFESVAPTYLDHSHG